jgi:nitrate reductase NapE component
VPVAPRPEPEVVAAAASAAAAPEPEEQAFASDVPDEPDLPAEPSIRRRRRGLVSAPAEHEYQAESAFSHEPPFRRRRNWAKMWSAAAALFAIISLGLVGAVAWYGMPDWMPMSRPLFAEAQPDLIIEFPPDRQDRRTLPNGTAYFGASGSVTNVGRTRRTVPMILIVLRDLEDRIVYTQQVAPPKRQLGPGESVMINEALTDVPNSAKYAEFGWKPG